MLKGTILANIRVAVKNENEIMLAFWVKKLNNFQEGV